MKARPHFKSQVVYATWRGPGWTPCLWSVRKRDAIENCDPDEIVIRVRVSNYKKRKKLSDRSA